MGIKLSSPQHDSAVESIYVANNFLPPSHFRRKALLKLEPRLFDVGASDLTD
jgi:hypothetical protein